LEEVSDAQFSFWLVLICHRYSAADEECQNMYKEHEGQQKRLRQIRAEMNELQEQI
jgi:hypothetical protein